MTGKERAEWRKQANTLPAIFQIGKDNLSDALIEGVDAALKKRELIKLSVLETSDLSAHEAAGLLAEKLQAEVIQCIGRKFVLYRKSQKKESQ